MRRKRVAPGSSPEPDPGLAPSEVGALFRQAMQRLEAGAVGEATGLFEESADQEGGEGAAIARAQAVRMMLARGHVDEAFALLGRSAERDPDVRWRTLGDVLEPLVRRGRTEDALGALIAAAEALPGARDFSAAFTGVVAVLQGVRVPEEVDRRILAALAQASGERLDARLAVERLRATREPQSPGAAAAALVRLADIAARALAQGDREVESRALTALCHLAVRARDDAGGEPGAGRAEASEVGSDTVAAGVDAGARDGADDDRDAAAGPLYEQPVLEHISSRLGAGRCRDAAAFVGAAARAAAGRDQPGAAAALERVAAVLAARAADDAGAHAHVERALSLAVAASDPHAEGDALAIGSWLAGSRAEPEVWGVADRAPEGDGDEAAGLDDDDDDDGDGGDEDDDGSFDPDLDGDDPLSDLGGDDDDDDDDDIASEMDLLDDEGAAGAGAGDDERGDARDDARDDERTGDDASGAARGAASRPGGARTEGARRPFRDLETEDDEGDPELVIGGDTEPARGDGAEVTGAATLRRSPLVLPRRPLAMRIPGEAAPVRVGGRPRLPRGLRWPRCAGCGDGLTFVAELRAPEVPLGEGYHRALVFACNVAPWADGYESRCDAGSSALAGGGVVLLDRDLGEGAAAPPERLQPLGTPELRARAYAPAEPDERERRGGPCLGGEGPEGIAHCPRCQSPLIPLLRLGGAHAPAVQVVNNGWLHVLLCSAACSDRGYCFWRAG